MELLIRNFLFQIIKEVNWLTEHIKTNVEISSKLKNKYSNAQIL